MTTTREDSPSAATRAARIDLMRHAESAMNLMPHLIGGRSNTTPLTQHGQETALAAGRRLAQTGYQPTALYSSPAVRTLHTAQLLNEAAGWALEIRVDDRLQELSQGDAEGQPRDQWWTPAALAAMTNEPLTHRLAPNAENHHDVQHRMRAALNNIAAHNPAGTVLIIGHGIAIRTLLWSRHGGNHHTGYQQHPLDNLATITWQY